MGLGEGEDIFPGFDRKTWGKGAMKMTETVQLE